MATEDAPLAAADQLLEEILGEVALRWWGVLDGELISLEDPGAAPIPLPPSCASHTLHCQLTDPAVDVFRIGDRFALTAETAVLTEPQRARCRSLAAFMAAMRPFHASDASGGTPAGSAAPLGLLERLGAAPTEAALSDRLVTDLSAEPWVHAVAIGTPTAAGDALTLDGHLPLADVDGGATVTDPLVDTVIADASLEQRSLEGDTTGTGLRRWARAHGATQLWAVPLVSDAIVHGVLLCGVDRPPADAVAFLRAVGTVAGRSIQAHRHANVTIADEDRDLVIDYPDMDGPIRTLAARLEAEVSLPQLSVTEPHAVVTFGEVRGVSTAAIQAAAAPIAAITALEPIVDGADPLVAMHVVEPGFHAAVASLGPYLAAVTVSAAGTTVRYRLPPSMPQRELLRQIEKVVGDGELRAVGAGGAEPRLPWTQVLRSRLTDQQLQILASAYHAGYFSAERPVTGTELAELLGMAQPTFATHLRAALQRLLEGAFADTADPLADVIRKKE